jgi:hypothetical protein
MVRELVEDYPRVKEDPREVLKAVRALEEGE